MKELSLASFADYLLLMAIKPNFICFDQYSFVENDSAEVEKKKIEESDGFASDSIVPFFYDSWEYILGP